MSMNDDEIIKQHTEIAQQSGDPNNIKTSVDSEQIKDLPRNVIATDRAFVAVSRAFEMFIIVYGSQFPALNQFLAMWQGYNMTWEKTMRESRDLATKTSVEFRRFDELYLIFIQKYEAKEDLKEAMEALIRFSNSYTGISMEFAEKFKSLERDVKDFRENFDRYLRDKYMEPELREKVEQLQKLFAALDPEFQIIRDGLMVFAQTWADFHFESLKFANVMHGLDGVKDIPIRFRLQVTLARDIATPLAERLNAYAHAG